MKRIILLLAAVGIGMATPANVSAQQTSDKSVSVKTQNKTRAEARQNPRRAHKGWRLVWADEFDAPQIDTASWWRCAAATSDWNKHMSPLDSLCRINNGVLELYAVRTPAGLDDKRPYITGGVLSEGKRSIRNGRVDVRARFDCTIGFWPAIWLMPDVKVGWPQGGEIDIMEHLNSDTIAYQTVHTPHTLNNREPKIPNSGTSPIDPNVFNVYSVVVTDNKIQFYINDKPTHSYPRLGNGIEEQFPFADHPFYVILSAQLGGSWVGKVDPARLPVKMEVDYVRFYKPRH